MSKLADCFKRYSEVNPELKRYAKKFKKDSPEESARAVVLVTNELSKRQAGHDKLVEQVRERLKGTKSEIADQPRVETVKEPSEMATPAKVEAKKPVTPQVVEAAPAAKEPWKMTKSDILKANPYKSELDYIGNNQMQSKALSNHKAVVEKAISEGKTIPAEVLAEYPDLAPNTAAKATPKESVLPEGMKRRRTLHEIVKEGKAVFVGDINKTNITNIRTGEMDKKQAAEYLRNNGIEILKSRPKQPSVTLESGGLQTIYERLAEKAGVPQEAYSDIVELGKYVYSQGGRTSKQFITAMKEHLGKLWDKYKQLVGKAWNEVKKFNERLGQAGQIGWKDIGGKKLSENVKATLEHLESKGITMPTVASMKQAGLDAIEIDSVIRELADKKFRNVSIEKILGESSPKDAKLDVYQALKIRLSSEVRGSKVGYKAGRRDVKEEIRAKRAAIEAAEQPMKDLRKAIYLEYKRKAISTTSFRKLLGYFDTGSMRKQKDINVLYDILGEMQTLPKGAKIVSREHKRALEDTIIEHELSDLPRRSLTQQDLLAKGLLGRDDVEHSIYTPSYQGKGIQPMVEKIRRLGFEVTEKAKRDADTTLNELSVLLKKLHKTNGSFDNMWETIKYGNRDVPALKEGSKGLSAEEIAVRDWMKTFLVRAEDVMTNVSKVERYLPIQKRGFFEAWKKDGFLEAYKGVFSKEFEREMTGESFKAISFGLGNQKFNRHALPRSRTKGVPFTSDPMAMMEGYVKLYYLKKALDPLLPAVNAIDAIVNLPKTSGFLKEHFKILEGQDIDYGTAKGVKKGINALNTVTYMAYLALNESAAVVNLAAGKAQQLVHQGPVKMTKGELRLMTPAGIKILLKQKAVAMPEELHYTKAGLIKHYIKILPFIGQQSGEFWIQGSQYLGELTRNEMRGDVPITANRDRIIKEKIARAQGAYREQFKPTISAYAHGRLFTSMKLWLISMMKEHGERARQNIKDVKAGDYLSESNKITLRELSIYSILFYIGMQEDDEDKSFLSKAINDILGFASPSSWERRLKVASAPLAYSADVIDALHSFATQEEYKGDGKYGYEGDTKWQGKAVNILPGRTQLRKLVAKDDE